MQICGFSLIHIFPYTSLDSVHIRLHKFGLGKTFIFAYLMPCQTDSIGKLRHNILLRCTCKILCMKRQTCSTDIFQCIFLAAKSVHLWQCIDKFIGHQYECQFYVMTIEQYGSNNRWKWRPAVWVASPDRKKVYLLLLISYAAKNASEVYTNRRWRKDKRNA